MKALKKVVIAPDSFKESLSALGVADAIERGFRQIYPQAHYVKLPMADGGEGTVESMVAATGGEIVQVTVTGPLGEPVQGFYGLLGDGETAVIEMAAASGLHLAPPNRRDPRITTSYGTGELMLAALERGVKAIILGIGGSATNDGGAGMMQALGVKLLDKDGRPLPVGGAALAQLAQLDLAGLDARWQRVSVTAACDVDNPLCGEKGASAVFGPQKGRRRRWWRSSMRRCITTASCWSGKPAAPCWPSQGRARRAAWGRRCSACSTRACGRASRSSLKPCAWMRWCAMPIW